jgi:hypothetical protein
MKYETGEMKESAALLVFTSMLDVGCWMLDVREEIDE